MLRKTTFVLVSLVTALLLVRGEALAERPSSNGLFARATQRVLRAMSKRNGNSRVLHRPGALYRAVFTPAEGSPLAGRTKIAAVRVSRGANAAQPQKDILGFAVRVFLPKGGGAEDLLMVSSGNGPVMRRLPKKAASFFERTYSSLLPFEVDGTKYLVRAYPTAAPRKARVFGTDLDEVDDVVGEGGATFRLELESLRGGKTRPLGLVTLLAKSSDAASKALKFDIWGNQIIRPAGLINRIRLWAYQGSQSTR